MGKSKLDPYKDEIIKLYKDGKSTYEIADMFSVHHSTIYTLIKKEGIELRKSGGHNKKELPIGDIVSLYKDGKSTIEIGEIFSVHHSTISNLLKKEDVELRKSGGHNKLDPYKEDIISLYKDGKSTIEIGDMFSVNRNTINTLLKREGIEIRKRGCGRKKIELPIKYIISLYKDGKNIYEIGRMFSVSHMTIYTLLKKEGIEIRKPTGKKKRELPIKDIISLYKDGKSTYEIGDMFSVNHTTIYRLLKREDIELRKCYNHKKKELPIDDIISLYKDGKSTYEIADIYSVHFNTINRLLKREGIVIRKRSDYNRKRE